MSPKRAAGVMVSVALVAVCLNLVHADHGVPIRAMAGSWILDAGSAFKTVASYTPIGGGKFAAVHSVINFDWSLDGEFPATHGSTLNGMVEKTKQEIDFILITYGLDEAGKAVYILKAMGQKVLKDNDTMTVENMVLHIYTDPDANPVTDAANFTIPKTGTFPPIPAYRIRLDR